LKIAENIIMALKNLRSNKARSCLTMLGIIIGVGAVITMVSLGDGAKRQITDRITAMGSNLLTVSPGKAGVGFITNNTVNLLKDSSDYIKTMAPAVRGGKLAESGTGSLDSTVVGCTPAYAAVRNYQTAYGRFLNTEDNSAGARVAVIGSYVAGELFPDVNPIGEEIKVAGVRLEIVGVLISKGQSGFGNADNQVLIPLSTAQERIFGNNNLSEINIQVSGPEYVDYTYNQVQQVLLDDLKDKDKFNVNNMAEVLSTAQDDFTAGWNRRGLPGGGWNRDHEYHAGIGDGTDPGDWDSEGHWRPAGRNFVSLFDGGHRFEFVGRSHRNPLGWRIGPFDRQADWLEDFCLDHRGYRGILFLADGGLVFRSLSGL
jgi:hypothetical protein